MAASVSWGWIRVPGSFYNGLAVRDVWGAAVTDPSKRAHRWRSRGRWVSPVACLLLAVGVMRPASATAQELEWAQTIDGRYGEEAVAVAVDPSGNVYTVGHFSGTVDFDPGPGVSEMSADPDSRSDAFVSKLDPEGKFLWAARFGGPTTRFGRPFALGLTSDEVFARDVAVDGAGNVYIAGGFVGGDFDPGPGAFELHATGRLNGDVFVAKLDTFGGFLWARAMGGAGEDTANGVAVDGTGNVYTVGSFEGIADFDPGPARSNLVSVPPTIYPFGYPDAFISKLDPQGNFLWARALGGPDSDQALDVALDGEGNVHTVGYFGLVADFDPSPLGVAPLVSNDGAGRAFVSKLDSDGNYVWARAGGGDAFDNSDASIAVDGAGNTFSVGRFCGEHDFDPGKPTFNLGGEDDCLAFIWKLDASGNFAWARALFGGLSGGGAVNGAAIDGSGRVYVAGGFYGRADFDPGPGTFELSTDDSGLDAFIAILDASGTFLWAGQLASSEYASIEGVSVDGAGRSYHVGSFRGTADLDPGPGTTPRTSMLNGPFSSPDAFVVKLSPYSATSG